MRALVIGDGKHEEFSLPIIVRRLNDRIRTSEFDVWRNSQPIHAKGQGVFKKIIGWILEAEKRGFDAIIIVVDEDGDRSRRSQVGDAQQYLALSSIPRACGIAIRSYDAWFLAHQQSFSSVVGYNVDRQPDPERLIDPKERCATLIADSSIDGLSELYRRLAQQMNFEVVRERCPQGFAVFACRVEELSN